MDDFPSPPKLKIHRGLAALQLGCAAHLETGSAQTFINTCAFDSMKPVGAASATCEAHPPPQVGGSPWNVPAC